MNPATMPLTWSTALTSWRWDTAAAVLIVGLCVAYGWAWRRGGRDEATRANVYCFATGIAVLIAATMSMIAVYDMLTAAPRHRG